MTESDNLRAAMKALGEAFLNANDRAEEAIAKLEAPAPVPEPAPPPPEPSPPPPEPAPPPPDPAPPPPAPSGDFKSPPLGSDGLANPFTFAGHKWSQRNGMAWNTKCPYAVGLTADRLRFELHDTVNDRGANDPDHKRRCEIGTSVNWPNSGFWFAFSVKTDIIGGDITDLGNTLNQFQSTDGSSPAFANRIQHIDGKVYMVQTTRKTGGSTKTAGKGLYALGVFHDVVNFLDFNAGVAKTWLDGKLVTDWKGEFGGSDGLRLGSYGAPLGGMKIIQEYANISPFPSAADLSARIANPPKP